MPRAVKADFPQEKWNKKKIILTFIILILLIIGGLKLKDYLLNSNSSPGGSSTSESVKGASVSVGPTVTLPSAQDIGAGLQSDLNNVKKEIGNINVQDLATSSPQIQKVVNDIKALPAVPGQQAKDICLKICNGL